MPPPEPPEEIQPLARYTVEQAAAVLGCSSRTVNQLCAAGELVAVIPGPHWVILGESLLAYMRAGQPGRRGKKKKSPPGSGTSGAGGLELNEPGEERNQGKP